MTSVPIWPSWLRPSSQSTLTCSRAAMAAMVSARGSRSWPGDSSWDRVERSNPARAAKAIRLKPERAITSPKRPRNAATV
jgi:hypothetical protein